MGDLPATVVRARAPKRGRSAPESGTQFAKRAWGNVRKTLKGVSLVSGTALHVMDLRPRQFRPSEPKQFGPHYVGCKLVHSRPVPQPQVCMLTFGQESAIMECPDGLMPQDNGRQGREFPSPLYRDRFSPGLRNVPYRGSTTAGNQNSEGLLGRANVGTNVAAVCCPAARPRTERVRSHWSTQVRQSCPYHGDRAI
jgi:hypothetical protein